MLLSAPSTLLFHPEGRTSPALDVDTSPFEAVQANLDTLPCWIENNAKLTSLELSY